MKKFTSLLLVAFVSLSLKFDAHAKKDNPRRGRSLKVGGMKKDYWALGDTESQYRVVQKRTYSKKNRFEAGVFGGVVASDPFLSNNNLGLLLGYYPTESIMIQLLGWKDFARDSGALGQLESIGVRSNSVVPYSYYGVGVEWSPIYGKLSLIGKAIIHYDLHISINAGYRPTESGNFIAGSLGIGQIFYLSQSLAVRFDYRLQYYSERVIEKAGTNFPVGTYRGDRLNRSDITTIGVSLMI